MGSPAAAPVVVRELWHARGKLYGDDLEGLVSVLPLGRSAVLHADSIEVHLPRATAVTFAPHVLTSEGNSNDFRQPRTDRAKGADGETGPNMPGCKSPRMGTARTTDRRRITTASRMAALMMPPPTEAGAGTVTKGVTPQSARPPSRCGWRH